MFARFLSKKKDNPTAPPSRDDIKMEKMIRTAATIDTKIEHFEKKADLVGSKREKFFAAAKLARSNKRDLETKRYLRQVKDCDEQYKRFSAMSSKLQKLKQMTEAYLDHSDFLQSVSDVSILVSEFGLKPADAERLMDNMRDIQDTIQDMDEAMGTGIDEYEDFDDLLGDIDEQIATGQEMLPNVPTTVVSGNKSPTYASTPSQRIKEQPEDDLDDMLNDL